MNQSFLALLSIRPHPIHPSSSSWEESLTLEPHKQVDGPIIVGATPSGLAVGAGLMRQGVQFFIIEQANCIASMWRNDTTDSLTHPVPKQFCELPYAPFPEDYPEQPSKQQYVSYLEAYANQFRLNLRFGETAKCATFDETIGLWKVKTVIGDGSTTEYFCRWVVVAGEENAEKVVPQLEGLEHFTGQVSHVSDYRSDDDYDGKRVLVVGCGNSGMEVSSDLCLRRAHPSMVLRNSVHVLPRQIMGKSTLELGEFMMRRGMRIQTADRLIVGAARLILGNVEKYGLKRPSKGPLELKNTEGKAPVLDTGAVAKIKRGEIKIVGGFKRFVRGGVELVNGDFLEIDSVILATGYANMVPSWLKGSKIFSEDGTPILPFPNGWRGEYGVYAVGFARRGLYGDSMGAVDVVNDIVKQQNNQTNAFILIHTF